MIQLDETTRIELVTDEHELRREGYAHPVVELYNDYHCVWLPMDEVSYPNLKRELDRITDPTRRAAEGDI